MAGATNHGPWKWLAGLLAVVLGAVQTEQAVHAGEGHARDSVIVDADYPGGNIVVDEIADNTVHVQQDLRETRGWWFYWNFRVRGACEQTLTFRFSGRSPIGVLGPAVSRDEGETWQWLGQGAVEGSSFEYEFPEASGEVRFAFAMPYHKRHLDQFLKAHGGAIQAGRLSVSLHCPWIRGKHNEVIYMVGSADKRIAAEQQRLGKMLETTCRGPLQYHVSDNLPFGTAWNTADNFK